MGSIYRDTQGLPAAMGQDIRSDVAASTRIPSFVKEWPVQRSGQDAQRRDGNRCAEFTARSSRCSPADPGEAVIEAELLKTLNMLYSAQEQPAFSRTKGISRMSSGGSYSSARALTTGYTYLFGFHNFRMHIVTTAAVSTSLALVVVLIIALDWPFRGEVSVTPDAFDQDGAVLERPIVRDTGPIRRATKRPRRQPVSPPAPLYDERHASLSYF